MEIWLSLPNFFRKLISFYRMNKGLLTEESKVSHIAAICREGGRLQQLFLGLRKRWDGTGYQAKHVPREKYTFDEMKDGWQGSGDVEISCDNDATVGGEKGLKVAGAGKSGGWSFAQSESYAIIPKTKYEFTASMLIETISESTSFIICNLYRRGKWLKSISSNQYDLSRKRQWQELTAEFVSPKGEDITVSFAVGKRPREKDVKAIIYLDAIRLEMRT